MGIVINAVASVKFEATEPSEVDLVNLSPRVPYGADDAAWWSAQPRLGGMIRRWESALRLEAEAARLVPLAGPMGVIEAERHRDRLARKAARIEFGIARRLVESGSPALQYRGKLYIGRPADDVDDLSRADAYRLTVVDLATAIRE
jgi:hypothetical protein